jgi:hypothetical protein
MSVAKHRHENLCFRNKNNLKFIWKCLPWHSNLVSPNNKLCHEIAMKEFTHPPKMNLWLFHMAIKKQIINK